MNLFTMAETSNNYSLAGANKAKMPFGKLLILAFWPVCSSVSLPP